MAIKIDPKAGNPWRGKDNKFAESPLPDDDGLKEKLLQALTARREKKAKLEENLAKTTEAELQTQLKAVTRVDALKTQLATAADQKRVQRKINRESLSIRKDLPDNAADLQTAISDRREQELERKELGKRQYNDLLETDAPTLTDEQQTALLQHMNLDRENVNPSDLITPLDSIPHSDISGLEVYRGITISPDVRVKQELKDFNYQSFTANKDVAILYSKAKQLDRKNQVPAVIITRTPPEATGLVPGRFEPSQIRQEEIAIGPGYSLKVRTVNTADNGSLEIYADMTKTANSDKPDDLLSAISYTRAPKSPLNDQYITATYPTDVEFERLQAARQDITDLSAAHNIELDDPDALEKLNALKQADYNTSDARNVKLVQYTQEDIDNVQNDSSNIQIYDLALTKQLAEDDKLNVNPVGLKVLKEYETYHVIAQKIRLLQQQWVNGEPENKEQILQEIGILRSQLPAGQSLDDIDITLGQLRTKAYAANSSRPFTAPADPLSVDFDMVKNGQLVDTSVAKTGTTFFHGTSKKDAQSLQEKGFNPTESKGKAASDQESPYALFVSKSNDNTDDHSAGSYGDTVVNVTAKRDLNLLDGSSQTWAETMGTSKSTADSAEWAQKLQQLGYDGIDEGNGEVQLWNNDSFSITQSTTKTIELGDKVQIKGKQSDSNPYGGEWGLVAKVDGDEVTVNPAGDTKTGLLFDQKELTLDTKAEAVGETGIDREALAAKVKAMKEADQQKALGEAYDTPKMDRTPAQKTLIRENEKKPSTSKAEPEEEYVPAENVAVENGKKSETDPNDTVFDLTPPAEAPDGNLPSLTQHEDEAEELTHSISVQANEDILAGIETVPVSDLGCIMIDVEPLKILNAFGDVEEDLVYSTDAHDHTMGAVAETEAHVTLLFGLLENGNAIKSNVDAALDGWEIPKIIIDKVDYFDLPEHYAVIAKVKKTPELVDGHERLTTLPNRQTFSEYTPHLTLAYIRKEADVDYWVDTLGRIYNGKELKTIGLNYGDKPSEAAKGTNPKVLRRTIEIEKKTHQLEHYIVHDGHTHAIDPALLDDVNVLKIQKDIQSADMAYAEQYIEYVKTGKKADEPTEEDGSLLFEAIVAAIVIYFITRGIASLKPTVDKLDKVLPRKPDITEEDLRTLGTEIGTKVAKSHTETLKYDLKTITDHLAAGTSLPELRKNEEEIAKFIPELKRLVNDRLTGRAKLIALNEATREVNKLSIFTAQQYAKENHVKILKRLASSTGSPCPACAEIIARTTAKPIPLSKPYKTNDMFDDPLGGNIHVGCGCYSQFVLDGKILSAFDPTLHPRTPNGKHGGQFRKKLGVNPFEKIDYPLASPTAFKKFNAQSLFTKPMQNGDEDTVNFFRQRIRRGLPVPPIAAQKADDDTLTIRDGYHRMRAFYLENREPSILIADKEQSYSLTQEWIDQNQWWNIIPKSLLEKPTDDQLNSLADQLPDTDQQTVFNHLYGYLGYNTKPTVLDDAEFDKTTGTEWTTGRGKTKYYDEFRESEEHYVSDLPTVYGPGTYFANDTGRADAYAGKDVNTVLAGKLAGDLPLLPADEGFDSQSYTDKRLKQLSLIAVSLAATTDNQIDKDFYKARAQRLLELRRINRLSLSSTLMGYPGIYVDNDTKNTTVADYLVLNDRGSILVRQHDKEFRNSTQQDTVSLTVAGGKKASFPAKYYRMGRPPESGRSTNHATGKLEDGTSVFKGYTDPTTGKTTIDALHDQNELANGKKFYEVSGEVLDSNGSDGEVLLKPGTAKIVKEVDAATVVTDNNPDYNLLGDDVSEQFETFPTELKK